MRRHYIRSYLAQNALSRRFFCAFFSQLKKTHDSDLPDEPLILEKVMKTLSDYVLVTVMSLILLMGEPGFSKSDAEFDVEDFYVVGVIAEKSVHSEGIVVLRSKTGNKSFTLRGGQLLPADGNWVIENIKRKRVVVSAGDTRIVLPYGMKQMDGYVEKKVDRQSLATFLKEIVKTLRLIT